MALQFQVPQFVDVEDKIFGPLTAKQFLMFVVAFLIIAALWVTPLPRTVVIILAIPVVIFVLLLAFYKVNGRSFVWFLYALAHYFLTGKRFLWERRGEERPIKIKSEDIKQNITGEEKDTAPSFNQTRIEKLAQILDASGSIVGEDAEAPEGFS